MQPLSRRSARDSSHVITGTFLFVFGTIVAIAIVDDSAQTLRIGELPGASELVQWAIWLFFAILMIGAGIKEIVPAVLHVFARVKVSAPEVELSSNSLALGESVTFRYRQMFKRATHTKGHHFQLVMRESATYDNGSSSETVTHELIVQQYDEIARHFRNGEPMSLEREFRVPRQGMHTFSAKYNKIDWLIRARVEISDWPRFEEEYLLEVQPRLV